MATAYLPPAFNQRFVIAATGLPAAGYKLYTYVSGTTTPQTTWQDQGEIATNTNPIILDTAGQCQLWLGAGLVYTLVLTDPAGVLVPPSWNNISGSALNTGVVTSVNTLTGAVSLSAPNIPFTTGTATTWFVGTDVGAAIDSIITYVNTGVPAASIPIADAGGYFTAPKNVETALQQVGARSNHGALLRITPFTSSGTWTKGTDVSFVMIEGVGGGGGSTNLGAGGGGGGAGGYFRRIVTTPGATETVTIGSGGTPGTAGNASSFGTWATANGGGGATGTTTGGIGGTATGGTINLAGGGGGSGGSPTPSTAVIFGHGGSSYFGGGAPGQWNGSTPTPGSPNTGGGGAGGTGGGGAGGSGLILVHEYS